MKLEIKIVDILRWLWGVTEQAQGYNLLLYFFFFLIWVVVTGICSLWKILNSVHLYLCNFLFIRYALRKEFT